MSPTVQYLISPVEYSHIISIESISKQCLVNSWSADDYRQELKRSDSLNFVCKLLTGRRENIIGFIFSRLISRNNIDNNDEYKSSENHSKKNLFRKLEKIEKSEEFDEAEILSIAVQANHQKSGVGQILFDEFKINCLNKGVRTIWLEVRSLNLRAQKFYHKNGFQKVGTRKNYYQNPLEDALLMKLSTSY